MSTNGSPEDRMSNSDVPPSQTDARTSELSQITRAMVAIYKEQFGRGPRLAHSHYAGPNAIVCFLEGSLTPLEQGLADAGEHARLREMRLWFQYAAEAQFRGAVETITRREVVSFQSGIDTDADVSVETFILAP
jgi:uncharacterized protein YbcI